MSYPYSSNFYPVDELAFDYSLVMNQEASPRRFLGDISISFESSFSSGMESTSGSYSGDYRHCSAGLVPRDSIYLNEETLGHAGILPPLANENLRTTFYPTQATYCPAKSTTSSRKRTADNPKQEGAELKKAGRKWEKMDMDPLCSMRHIKGVPEYRCDVCHKAKKKVITTSYGEMKRHHQSWAH